MTRHAGMAFLASKFQQLPIILLTRRPSLKTELGRGWPPEKQRRGPPSTGQCAARDRRGDAQPPSAPARGRGICCTSGGRACTPRQKRSQTSAWLRPSRTANAFISLISTQVSHSPELSSRRYRCNVLMMLCFFERNKVRSRY